MNKYILTSAISLALMGSLTSCSDFLEASNKSTVTAEEQFSTATGWNQLLNQAYVNMRSIYSNPMIFCSGTDMYTTSQGASQSILQTYQYNADYSDIKTFYENCYKTINQANCVLKYSSDAKLIDQAKFIRDYAYYILTQQFGSVPYITSYIESAETNYPKTDLATIYTNTISELETIIANGNLDAQGSAKEGYGKASILAAKALLAKVYLAAGWDIQTSLGDAATGTYTVNSTEYFSKAAAYASEVANTIPLSQSFTAKWDFDKNEKGENIENIFAIQYDRASASDKVKGGHDQQHYFGGYMGSNTLGLKALKNDLCPTERVYYAYDKGDDRYEGTFMTTIYGYDGNSDNWSKQGYWAAYNTTDKEKSNLKLAWKFFPWYTTTEEIDSFKTVNADKFVTTGLKSKTQIVKVADNVSSDLYTADGSSFTNTTLSFSSAISKIGYLPPVKKFDDKNTTSEVAQSGGCYRDLIVLDASEIYLVAAEAYLMAGDEANSLQYLNAVRSRANATVLSSFEDYQQYDWTLNDNEGGYINLGATNGNGLTINKLDVILDERMRETIGEYYRWMDLRRTKQLVRYNIAYCEHTVSSMSGNDGQIKWLRPIPTNEIELNTGISYSDQNPGF